MSSSQKEQLSSETQSREAPPLAGGEEVTAHLGITLSGGISVPLNFNFTEEEMVYFLNDSGARFIFASGRQASLIRQIKDRCRKLGEIIDPTEVTEMRTTTKLKAVPIESKDYCLMLYSSGTTGRPKGVVHTHGNVGASLLALQKCWKFTPDDVLLNVLPLFHIHGLSFAAHLALISGSSMLLEDKFHPLRTMKKMKDATVFMGVPTMYYAFLRRSELREEAREWHRIRLLTCGSAAIRSEVIGELEVIMGRNLTNRYGMTESHVITSLPLDGPFKGGSVGLPLEGIEMKLVSESGRNLSGESEGQNDDRVVGEVKIRSENLFSHYWKKPDATNSAFDREGFFSTGDLGYLDEDGFLTLVGRKDDLIITHGYNVYPPVVERVLNEFPQVKESAVVGIPDRRRGEKVVAVIVPSGVLDMKELRKHCQAKLADYQRPTHFELVEELPRNTMSKVLKRRLREELTKGV